MECQSPAILPGWSCWYWYAPRGGPTQMWAEFNDWSTRHELSFSFDQIFLNKKTRCFYSILFESMKKKRSRKKSARESKLALNWKKSRKFNSIRFAMCRVQKTIDNINKYTYALFSWWQRAWWRQWYCEQAPTNGQHCAQCVGATVGGSCRIQVINWSAKVSICQFVKAKM